MLDLFFSFTPIAVTMFVDTRVSNTTEHNYPTGYKNITMVAQYICYKVGLCIKYT